MNGPDVEHAGPFSCPSAASVQIFEREIAAVLSMVGGVADRATVCRTQRRVRERAAEMAERKRRARQGIGLAILCLSLLLLVLTPVLWVGVHLLRDQGWSGFASSEMQCMYVIGWLFPVTAVGSALGCMRVRAGRKVRRVEHRFNPQMESLVR